MSSDLLRPRALLSHLLVLAVAAGCVWLGSWQLDRLGQVRSHNELLAARLVAEPFELAALAEAGAPGVLDQQELEFRRVVLTGRYRAADEILQRGQTHQGQQGFHLLTPFEIVDGGVVLVRRGWVPADLSEPPVREASPPAGEVTLRGILERPVGQPGFGPRDPEQGHLARVFHTDTTRLAPQIDGDLFPMIVRAEEPIGAGDGVLPLAVGSPELDGGNHLSYALQWFSFALLALITYGAWLRTRRRRTGPVPVPAEDGTDDRGPARRRVRTH